MTHEVQQRIARSQATYPRGRMTARDAAGKVWDVQWGYANGNPHDLWCYKDGTNGKQARTFRRVSFRRGELVADKNERHGDWFAALQAVAP